MSMQTEGRAPGQFHDDGAPPFAPVPAWERSRKPRRAAPATGTRGSSTGPMVAVAAVVVGLGFAGAATWYALHESTGVPELTAGEAGPPAPTPDLTAEIAPVPAPLQATEESPATEELAANETPPPAAAPAPVRHTTAKRQAAPRAASADETGADASATALPAGPTPYTELETPSAEGAALPQTPPILPTPEPSSVTPQDNSASPPTL